MAEQWEYWWVSVTLGTDALHKSMGDAAWVRIDELGQEGWEAVGLAPIMGLVVGSTDIVDSPHVTVPNTLTVLLKRRKP